MEFIDKSDKTGKTICFMGSHGGVGRNFISFNFSAELARRRFRVVYGMSSAEKQEYDMLYNNYSGKSMQVEEKVYEEIFFLPTDIQGLKFLSFSKEAPSMSPQKLEEMLVGLPGEIKQRSNYFIFSLKDPFEFPDRYILLNTDIYIMVVKREPSVFSDVFQQLEKLSFLPKQPECIYLVFNQTKNIQSVYDTYTDILSRAQDFNINLKLYLLGMVPPDYLRIRLLKKSNMPLPFVFPESPICGSISFMLEKILKILSKEDRGAAGPAVLPALEFKP